MLDGPRGFIHPRVLAADCDESQNPIKFLFQLTIYTRSGINSTGDSRGRNGVKMVVAESAAHFNHMLKSADEKSCVEKDVLVLGLEDLRCHPVDHVIAFPVSFRLQMSEIPRHEERKKLVVILDKKLIRPEGVDEAKVRFQHPLRGRGWVIVDKVVKRMNPPQKIPHESKGIRIALRHLREGHFRVEGH